jgi:site-specific DNA-methyltransferase (adenine-specific)
VEAVSPEPYYSDNMVQLYHGDMHELIYGMPDTDACVTDPPYGTTALPWDSWPPEWPLVVAHKTSSMWCFGSMTTFFARITDFVGSGWKMSQDVVWEKHNGSGFAADRFKRVHEHVIHWYRGQWRDIHHETPREARGMAKQTSGSGHASRGKHLGAIGDVTYTSKDRLVRSVIRARSMHGRSIHPTEKPAAILAPLIEYSIPQSGLVLDPFAVSGSTLLTARSLGRRAIGIEANEEYCEKAAKRLAEPDLFGGAA